MTQVNRGEDIPAVDRQWRAWGMIDTSTHKHKHNFHTLSAHTPLICLNGLCSARNDCAMWFLFFLLPYSWLMLRCLVCVETLTEFTFLIFTITDDVVRSVTGAKTIADRFQNEFEEELFNFSTDWPLKAWAACINTLLHVCAGSNIQMHKHTQAAL